MIATFVLALTMVAAEPQTATATTTDDVAARGKMAVRFPTYLDALDGLVRYDKALHSAIVTHTDDIAAIRKLTEPSSGLALDICALVGGTVAGVGGTCAGTIGDARTECLVGGGISLAVALTCGIIRLAQ